MPPRKTIPPQTRLAVLLEAAYRCGNPRCNHILTLDIHHIVWVKDGGGNDASNLIALCPNCHSLHTGRYIPIEAIRHWKGMLVALNRAFDRSSTDLLLFLSDGDWDDAYFTPDAVLRFAALIAAGLVERSGNLVGGNIQGRGINQQYCRLRLTSDGRALVEAWKSGDEEAYRTLVSKPGWRSVPDVTPQEDPAADED